MSSVVHLFVKSFHGLSGLEEHLAEAVDKNSHKCNCEDHLRNSVQSHTKAHDCTQSHIENMVKAMESMGKSSNTLVEIVLNHTDRSHVEVLVDRGVQNCFENGGECSLLSFHVHHVTLSVLQLMETNHENETHPEALSH